MHELVTARIHISGLTPAITKDELLGRLRAFGTVASLDGFGEHDALCQRRKFAYATLETTREKFSKCMMLSGSMWKGAMLRMGEARPDFRERISLESALHDDSPRPRKRARLAREIQGFHAPDMSLVSPTNVHLHPQWHVTPLGRLIRPMRMRPVRPLDPPLKSGKSGQKQGGMTKKERKRKREPPMRARRRVIDPVRWGSTQVKGVFLEAGAAGARLDALEATQPTEDASESEEKSCNVVQRQRDSGDRGNDIVQVDAPLLNHTKRVEDGRELGGDNASQHPVDAAPNTPTPALSQTHLAGLFSLHEDERFSLLGHLKLDLDLDESAALIPTTITSLALSTPSATQPPPTSHLPPFFVTGRKHAVLETLRDTGWDFTREASKAEQQERWEMAKIELTGEWKRRHREVVKAQRRRGGDED
ncbi:hypothetical protein OF83DRAFT_371906 [Amylostereum chailletii]|nr:hypothetical protein OF83DRAFT_371906 [Amylostereum chailletii]